MKRRPSARARFRAVTFDCWDTLIAEADPRRAFELRFMRFRRFVLARRPEVARQGASGEAVVDGALTDAWQAHADTTRRGEHSGARNVAVASLGRFGIDDAESIAEVAAMLSDTRSERGIVALPGALANLCSLARRGVRTGLVCNTGLVCADTTERWLAELGLLSYLQARIFSDRVGRAKPDTRPFELVLDGLGIPGHAAVHVGDSRRCDVAGARACGMPTVRMTACVDDRGRGPEADRVVGDHAALAPLLRGATRWPPPAVGAYVAQAPPGL